MSVYKALAHYLNIEEEANEKRWYYDILQYVKNQQYLEKISKNDKMTLRKISMRFFSNGEILYKKGKDQMPGCQ